MKKRYRRRLAALGLLLLGGILGGVNDWWSTVVSDLFWPAERLALGAGNVLGRKTRPVEGSFRVVLCWLDRDRDGTDTELVFDAFHEIDGVKLVRSARSVTSYEAADDRIPEMERKARSILADWQGDIALVGKVKKPGEAFNLYIVPRSSVGTLSRGDTPYLLHNSTVGFDFQEDFRETLATAALEAVAPLAETETRGRVLERGLRGATTKLANLLAKTADDPPDRRRAKLQVSLGKALVSLGEREGGAERLERAVEAFEAALEVYATGRDSRLEWAMTQDSLGTALMRLGERGSGTAFLERAVDAFEAALDLRARDGARRDWALTQVGLGLALGSLGEREDGTDRLERAVGAYEAALQVLDPKDESLEWVMAQDSLGLTHAILAQRENDTGRLEQAVDAYEAAFEVPFRSRAPQHWARTQGNLARALLGLSLEESGTERAEYAVDAFRAALQVATSEDSGIDWADTQVKLGTALLLLDERESDTERVREAVDAVEAALEVFARESDPSLRDFAEQVRDMALERLRERGSEP